MNQSYYFTWTKQEDAPQLEIQSTTQDSYVLKDDQEVYDLSSCSYHLSFGLRNDTLTKVITTQYHDLPVAGPKIVYPLKQETTKKLINFLELEDNGKIFYTVSGAEAIENALKIARQYTGKDIILSRKKSYHGATVGALSITGDWRRDGSPTMDALTEFIPEPDALNALEETEELINKIGSSKIAALCLESITGGNGVIIPTQKWYDGIQALCKKYEILLILDEVVCGFARTGRNFGFHNYNLVPDIVCMAKGISGGLFPFGAVYTSEKISKYFDKNVLSCGLTNYAHPVGLKLCSAIIDLIHTQEFNQNFKALEDILSKFSKRIITLENIVEVRAIGLLAAIQTKGIELDWNYFIKNGIYINSSNGALILTPILTTTPKRLEKALEKLEDAIKDLS